MKKIDIVERKEIQVQILDVIHKFCLDNDINYSLGYGTLLGAIRHKGYIPWDDDIDIVMLRKDYDKFITLFSTPRYKVADVNTVDNWFLPFAKVYDNMTIIVDRKAHTTSIGINVDVFPIDDVSSSKCSFIIQKMIIKILSICNIVKLFKINKESNIYRNILGIIAKILLVLFPKYSFLNMLIKLSRINNEKGYSRAFCWASVDDKVSLDKNLYENLSEVFFEGHFYKAIYDFDSYLSSIYGDYMKLPPEEKRVSFHTSDAYWK